MRLFDVGQCFGETLKRELGFWSLLDHFSAPFVPPKDVKSDLETDKKETKNAKGT